MRNPYTSISGLLTILAGVGTVLVSAWDGNPATTPDYALMTALITAGLGLIAAGDRRKGD